MFSFTAKGTSQVVQLAIFILAARVLSSAEFGFFAFISAFLVMLIVLAEGGWGEYLMKAHDTEAELDLIATTSLISASAVSLAALAGALAIGHWFGNLLPPEILVIFSALIFVSTLSTFYDAILVSQGRLRDQALIRIASELVGLAVVAAGLWAEWGILALFAGRLASQVFALTVSAIVVAWLPRLHLSRPFLREILGFSRHILANRLIFFLRSYSATLAVGSFLGLAEAGYYRAAERIVAGISELIAEPARMLSWVVFRRARDRHPPDSVGGNAAIARAANAFQVRFLAIAAPLFLCLALGSGSLVHFVLGEAWMPTATVVTILAVRQLLLIPAAIIEPLLSMVGEMKRLPPVALLNGAVSVLVILVSAPFGLIPLAVGQCLVGGFWLFRMIWLQQRHAGLDWFDIVRRSRPTFIAIGAMLLSDVVIDSINILSAVANSMVLGFQVLAGGIVYVAAQLLLRKAAQTAAPAPAPLAQQHNP